MQSRQSPRQPQNGVVPTLSDQRITSMTCAVREALALCATAGLLLAAMPAAVNAQEAATAVAPTAAQKSYAIAAGNLDQVLTQFAREANVDLTVPAALTRGKSSSGLNGRFTVTQGFGEILKGQDLQAERRSNGNYVIIETKVPSSGQLPDLAVRATAEEASRQSLGASTITREDIERRAPANDLSEIIRTMPGVNLTGAGSSGGYGNQRQIDLRGMGPENTMVLIDGMPVNSRDSQMMRRSGERDTHGDTNWVPAEAVERIDVIRGPAAARYGSGAAAGVVNIITKKPTDKLSGSVTMYYSKPENDKEGGTQRLGFNVAGPISENLSFRVYGNMAKTDADAPDINASEAISDVAAGREGTRNKDINTMFLWKLTRDQKLQFDFGYSRQGNIYTGEYPVAARASADMLAELANAGAEVRRTYRKTASVVHTADWGEIGDSRIRFQYEETTNVDCTKGTTGGIEAACNSPLSFTASNLKSYFLNGELHTPMMLGGMEHMLTSGLEYRYQSLNDPGIVQQAAPTGISQSTDPRTSSQDIAAYVEDNIQVTQSLLLTPGLRFDQLKKFGSNIDPSLNATYTLSPTLKMKAGIARVFKAPNLYQSDPNYWYTTRGTGCPTGVTGPCYIQGNENLDPEISVNKEFGLAWNNNNGADASLSYFRNDYQNKIAADMYTQTATNGGTYRYYQWNNTGPALVHGLEGNLDIPLLGEAGDKLKWRNNLTWMFSNKNKLTGQPLSVIPHYTLNSSVDWHPSEQWSMLLTATVYGAQKSRTLELNGDSLTGVAVESIGSYSLFGWSTSYEFNKKYRINGGISNLLNRTILRRSNNNSAGAYTYNEPGRAYYISLTASF
jgi:ferric enterobactin receptor